MARSDAGLVAGVGEPMRGDDGIGPAVVRTLHGHVPPGVRLVERVVEPTALLDLWSGSPLAVVVDAGRTGAPPGSILRLTEEELARAPAGTSTSSHGLSVRDAAELGRQLGRAPRRLLVYLVELAELGTGRALSPPVERARREAARRIASEFSDEPPPPRGP
ncbi:MAG TPA: hydrogenase maturation protease [Thermoplasmata archaeon]|nr:hydrogenase maturation protease [Thermoplasmata archaeon]